MLSKVFRDPLYGYVRVNDEIIDELINSKEFQRLRRIKQLCGVSMVFHMADHTRFSHSFLQQKDLLFCKAPHLLRQSQTQTLRLGRLWHLS